MIFAVVLLLFVALAFVAMFFGFRWYYRELKKGAENIVCPHCHYRGYVTKRRVRRKRGVSGGKATAAVFTLGTSMLATGLSRKEAVTAMRCRNCHTRWDA